MVYPSPRDFFLLYLREHPTVAEFLEGEGTQPEVFVRRRIVTISISRFYMVSFNVGKFKCDFYPNSLRNLVHRQEAYPYLTFRWSILL